MKPEPRIDEDGAGWASSECLQRQLAQSQAIVDKNRRTLILIEKACVKSRGEKIDIVRLCGASSLPCFCGFHRSATMEKK